MNEVTVVEAPKLGVKPAGLATATPAPMPGRDINILMSGQRLQITADVDLEGVAKLKLALEKYEELLKLLSN